MQFPLLIVTVHIYRLLTADTIEEKILERAELKLRMDAVVIQSGKASNSKGVDGNQMLAAIRYGADKVFRGDGAAITDDDIDAIINRGKEKTEQMKKVLSDKAKGDVLDFKLEYTTSLQEFDGIDYTEERKRLEELKKQEALQFALAMGNAIGKRSRTAVTKFSDEQGAQLQSKSERANYYRQLGNNANNVSVRSKSVPRPRDYPRMKVWQFFNVERLAELQDLENEEFVKRADLAMIGQYVVPGKEDETRYIFLNDELQKEKVMLLKSGFKNWSRHNYRQFIRACTNHGRANITSICNEMKSNQIAPEQTKRYHKIYFEEGISHLGEEEYNKNLQSILKGESRVELLQNEIKDVQTVVSNYVSETNGGDPRQGLYLIYNNVDDSKYTEENDAFLMCEMSELGQYGFFDEMRKKIQHDTMFTFDYFFRSRTTGDLERRCKSLLRCAGKHIVDAKARKERRDKAADKKMKSLMNEKRKKELREQKKRDVESRRKQEQVNKILRKEAREKEWAKKRAEKAANPTRRKRSRGVTKILPEGWIVKQVLRTTGTTAGTSDKYFIAPNSNKRFRSYKEVERHLGYALPAKNPSLDDYDDDEMLDDYAKGRPKKKSKSGQGESSSEEESSEEEESSSEEEEEETDAERKKRKTKEYIQEFTKKNLGMKNPPTAYVLYMSAIRAKTAAEYPTLKTQQILKLIGPMWKALSAKEAEPYREKAKERRRVFQEAKKIFVDGKLAEFQNGPLIEMMKKTMEVHSSSEEEDSDEEDSDEEDSDDEPPAKRQKVVKKPTRQRSAYLFFSMARRKQMKQNIKDQAEATVKARLADEVVVDETGTVAGAGVGAVPGSTMNAEAVASSAPAASPTLTLKQEWESMTEEQKSMFMQLALDDLKRFTEEKEKYDTLIASMEEEQQQQQSSSSSSSSSSMAPAASMNNTAMMEVDEDVVPSLDALVIPSMMVMENHQGLQGNQGNSHGNNMMMAAMNHTNQVDHYNGIVDGGMDQRF